MLVSRRIQLLVLISTSSLPGPCAHDGSLSPPHWPLQSPAAAGAESAVPGDLAGPLPVGAVQAGRVAVAAAVGPAAAGAAFGDRAGQDHAGGGDGGQFGGDLRGFGLVAGGDTHGFRVA